MVTRAHASQQQPPMQGQQAQLEGLIDTLPDNCSNNYYIDIEAKKIIGSGSFGKHQYT